MNARYDHLCNYLDMLGAGAEPGELLELCYRLPYIACAPRLGRGGTRGDVAASAVVWADLDTPEAVKGWSGSRPPPPW